MGEPMRAAIYTRVSTEEQAEHGYSIDEQERRCRDFIDREGWSHVGTFPERGVSGTLKTRPQLDRLLASTDDLDVVVINSLDRLGRSTKNLLELYDRFEKAGVALVFLRERLDTSTPVGRLLRTVLSAIAEFERDLIAERTSATLGARARSGKHTGGPRPFGYEWEDGALVVVEDEKRIVCEIFDAYIRGVGQRQIVRDLNARGIKSNQGTRWSQSAITRILSSVVYKGMVEHRGQTYPGIHKRIVDEAVWDHAQRSSERRRNPGKQAQGSHLLVNGTLRCECGSAMIPRKARPGVERERYQCRGRVEHGPEFCSQPSIRRELVDEPFLASLLDHFIDMSATRRRIAQRGTAAISEAREEMNSSRAEALRLDARLPQIEADYVQGKSPPRTGST